MSNLLSSIQSHLKAYDPRNVDWTSLKESLTTRGRSADNLTWKHIALLSSSIVVPPLLYMASGAILSQRRRKNLFSNVLIDHSTSATKQKIGQMTKDYDVIIVGAGIIGCALSATLAKKHPDWSICVIERDLSQPDRIIGELLQPGGIKMLKALDLEHCVEDIDASVVSGYGVFLKGHRIQMQYPADENGAHPSGRGLHYGRFIQKLRDNLQQYSNVKVVEGSVLQLLDSDGVYHGVEYRCGEEIISVSASLTVVANGAGSGFTKRISGTKPLSRSTFVGVRIKGGNDVLPFPYHGNVFMMNPGPVLAYPTSSEDVRVLVDFPNGTMPPMSEMANYLRDNIAPQFPEEKIRNAFLNAVDEGDIRSVPNREMPAERSRAPGVLLLGDALTQRHPLTGSGMTAGLTDVFHVSRAFANIDLNNYEVVRKQLDQWWANRNSAIATINILANALYAVFTPAATPDPYVGLLQDACFNYFQMGGICVSGPVSMLGGLTKSPYILISHYFGVAFFTVKAAFNPLPTPWGLYGVYRAFKCAVGIVFPLLAEERIFKPFIPTGFWNRDAIRYSRGG